MRGGKRCEAAWRRLTERTQYSGCLAKRRGAFCETNLRQSWAVTGVLRNEADLGEVDCGLGLILRGKPFQLLELARISKITRAVSDAILDEMEDILRRKFGWNDDDIVEGASGLRLCPER